PGIEILPVQDPLQPGDASQRLRIIDARFEGRTYTARVQGLSGRNYRVRLEVPFEVVALEGAREVARDGQTRVLEVNIPYGPAPWTPATVAVTVGKRLTATTGSVKPGLAPQRVPY
ncbi:MAG: hypothetical protein IMZ65_02560, partial [Planctomycetes bacterium]|nr:hypothetical protein [Planctomycetota bacterium]